MPVVKVLTWSDANKQYEEVSIDYGGADTYTSTASGALAAGDFVYIKSDGTVAKADASNQAKKAMGYVLAASADLASCVVYFDDNNNQCSGLTVGSTYYLSGSTPGAVTATPPTTSNHIVQELGIATTTTNLHVNIGLPIKRA